MKFPTISGQQVALMRCDANTGEVLDEKFVLFTNDNQSCYTVFDTFELAKLYIEKTIRPMRNVEALVYDAHKEVLFFYEPGKK